MKLSLMYAGEFKAGGNVECLQCGKPSTHSGTCVFCLDRLLRSRGVSVKTMRLASAVFRRGGDVESAAKAIEKEIKSE